MAASNDDLTDALRRLDEITRRLRRECPWDREQDERSIVPHTVEEAYELADAAHEGDDEKLVDELGDVLFQVYFLSLLLEERGRGDLARVADTIREKLIRRHPHVFGEVEARDASAVKRNWDQIKREEEGRGIFGELSERLPATLYAKKAHRRAARVGVLPGRSQGRGRPPLPDAGERLADASDRDERFEAAGELLLSAVTAAVEAEVDPELALREAANRFMRRIEEAHATSE